MKKLWRLFNSRKFAVYLLFVFFSILVLSSFLPSKLTMPVEKWIELKKERPVIFWLSERFSTPYVVKGAAFIGVSFFLFLSTFACTLSRLLARVKTRRLEFEKELSFSFSVEGESPEAIGDFKARALDALRAKKWDFSVSEDAGAVTVEAEKGRDSGFWGSVVFHAGLLVCFLAAPVTALTVLRGDFILTEGVTSRLREVFVSETGKASSLPDADITVGGLKRVYAKGIYDVDFRGKMRIEGRTFNREFPFSVNNPIDLMGYQITLQEFGYSAGVVMEKQGEKVFDYFLNLRHPVAGDYFDLQREGDEGLKLYALFFPDFFREGNKLGTRSKEPRNPVLVVRLFKGGEEISKGLLKLGEEAMIGDYRVKFNELRNWAGFIVVKESGVPVLALGMLIGLPGLLVRFLSNERRLEIGLKPGPSGTKFAYKGYSRYYPAFLEGEVRGMAEGLKEGGDWRT
ncbi:MAG: cytochrome c biogenesis protein ResB [Thermodesulfovibrionales bacterium]|nr:cytochrome c biogenesis protein ResB [Thermodesulfovibrionales bacterium]